MAESSRYIPKEISQMAKTFAIPEGYAEIEGAEDDDEKISVNQALGKVTLLYEKLRVAVDYAEEHLLRKAAIHRALKRLVLIERRREDLGMTLVQELIRLRYLPNSTVPQRKAAELDAVLDKYILINSEVVTRYQGRKAFNIMSWWLQIAACEIEETLYNFQQRSAIVSTMQSVLERDVALPDSLTPQQQSALLHLAGLRALFRSDESILYYYLLSVRVPGLFSQQTDGIAIRELIGRWDSEKAKMDAFLNHRLSNKLNKIARRYAVYFIILRDVLTVNQDKIEEVLSRPRLLESEISALCSKRYQETRSKVIRSVIRSIIYIFVTKMLIAFVLEAPVDLLLEGHINYVTLAINVFFPPFLMFIASLFIRVPKDENTEKIITEVKDIVYQQRGVTVQPRYTIRHNVVRGGLAKFFYNLFYLITYGITFGVVIYALIQLNFNIVSGGIFIFFLSVVSFFTIRIRTSARDLVVLENKDGFINLLFDFFTIPVIRLGHWLSFKLSKINVFIFLLDFIIEAPLKIMLDALEDWFGFMREKKEEIY